MHQSLLLSKPGLRALSLNQEAELRLWEKLGIAGLVLLWLGLRSFSVYDHLWDSDEAQHLHVVWEWTQGLLPYRDFFDNHTPLFHVLFAPVLRLFGERADIIELMRGCMVPLIALIFWCTYRIGAQVFSRRVGIIAALLGAFYPHHFFKIGEFRTDVLWTVFWMLSLVWLTRPGRMRRHEFLAGLALGAAFAASQKTVLLALVLLAGTAGTLLLTRLGRRHAMDGETPPMRSWRPLGPWFWLGLCLVPAGFLGFFWAEGAWSRMVYCVVRFNLSTGEEMLHRPAWLDPNQARFWLIVPTAVVAWQIWQRSFSADRARRQVFLLLVGGSYCTVLFGLWTVVSAQDYLPYYPVWLIGVVAGLAWLGGTIVRWAGNREELVRALLVLLLFGAEITWLVKDFHFSRHRNQFKIEQVREVLALTRPDEAVLDAKGGSIYRPRAVPYVMETLTRWRMREGQLANDVPQRLVQQRTAVAINLSWFPRQTQDFINANYVWVGLVHVAGKTLFPGEDGPCNFQVLIPGRYRVVSAQGSVSGRLDGHAVGEETLELEPGPHRFQSDQPVVGPIYLLAEQAVARGFTPFNEALKSLEPGRKYAD
ncbi:MAG TPA: glycosyltransferase family 39 protein [Chthoniobacterales bacterium]